MSRASTRRTKELGRIASGLNERLHACDLCPRRCGVDRLRDGLGRCRTGAEAIISSAFSHFGEESCLVGTRGSGTVFFAGCGLGCVFCQNHEISHGREGFPVDAAGLARIFLGIQAAGCHNLNLVTPSHVVPQIVAGLDLACRQGLDIPVVYNTSGYDSVETLRAIAGVVDVYMPDLKFLDASLAGRFLDAPDYPEVARAAIAEMHRQVGDLVLDENGIATRGLLVRHLVMPGATEDALACMRFLASVSPDTAVNVMAQYRPLKDAFQFSQLCRRPTSDEIRQAQDAARAAGLRLV